MTSFRYRHWKCCRRNSPGWTCAIGMCERYSQTAIRAIIMLETGKTDGETDGLTNSVTLLDHCNTVN